MLKDVTFIIKTFERHECLITLLDSIDKYYPGAKCIIADDSKEPIKIHRSNVEWFSLPFDSGLSLGRNEMVKRVKTKYFLLLDDDFIFTSQTKIENFINIMENIDLDICGGLVYNYKTDELVQYFGNFVFDEKTCVLTQSPIYFNTNSNVRVCDLILNFFIAKTDSVLKMGGWDSDLKLAEHTDFFWRAKLAKLKVAYTQHVTINHSCERNNNYAKYRSRGKHFTKLMMSKHGIKSLTNVHGGVLTIK